MIQRVVASPPVKDPPAASPYAVEWLSHNLPDRWEQGAVYHLHVRAKNTGLRTWLAHEPQGRCVDLVVRVNGQPLQYERVPHNVPPGGEVAFAFGFNAPVNLLRGRDSIEMSLSFVEQNVAWFEQHGAAMLRKKIATEPMADDLTSGLMLVARSGGTAYYQPSGGSARGRDGRPYPLIVRHAVGCRFRDPEGNGWIDYVMGWGSALLGYGRPEIREAIAAELAGGAIVSLPHEREIEVTQLLGEMIPCAQMALFGKNGSDACTAAVRLARVFTGRPMILFSGYSGWQDTFAGTFEPALRLPDRPEPAVRFPPNDLPRVLELLDEHKDQVAAVMIEPAAQVEGVDGPVRAADADYLRALAAACQERGVLLIFDEIMTGFRHPGGSVQKFTGVVPDLACFGKALSSGMPLSAVVGRRDIFAKAGGKIFYHPTFKGEAYSFAAAAATLKIYQQQDVPAQIAAFGTQLMEAINETSRAIGVDGEVVGQPYRMVYRFNEPDSQRRTLLRTLLQQELLKGGILCFRGFMLPSTAHGEAELQQTIEIYSAALQRVADYSEATNLEQFLEIPLVV